MPRVKEPRSAEATAKRLVAAEEKIARLLGVIATKDMPRKQQCKTLRAVGFDHDSIADMLSITSNQVAVELHRANKDVAARKQDRGENKPATVRKAANAPRRESK